MPVPTGTVTFLFTDIEGSTRLWEEQPDAMRLALARHDKLLRDTIESNAGVVFKTIGDAFCAAFATPSDALHAALSAQLQLQTELNHGEHGGHGASSEEETRGQGDKESRAVLSDVAAPAAAALGGDFPSSPLTSSASSVFSVVPIRVRIALHTGEAQERDGDYFGPTLNRVARLLSTGYGQQTLLSLTTYQLVRDNLPTGVTLRDLGSHRLKDLQRPEQVFQLLHPSLPAAFAPLKSLDNPSLPNNLPQQLTSFVGREKEMAEVKALLTHTRLLTLVGAGGFGKTRLSLQVAADMLTGEGDGVWLVELAPISDPALLPQTVANALCVTEQTGKTLTQTLIETLKPKCLLLILDNCEHLVEACAQLADALLKNCPQVQILASSREALNIAGEQTYRMPALSLPAHSKGATVESLSQYEGVRLFVERALAVQPAFAVTNQNAPALAQLCARLDGIPLAIELAAARIRSLSVEEINTRLDNVFRLLTGGSRTALPRQQTLRALVDWSYNLLEEQEKVLLARLSVFVGGWTLEAAEKVCADETIEAWEMLDLLTALADKSLIIAAQEGESTRCKFLETMRQYSHDRLAESGNGADLRQKHFDFFLHFVRNATPQLAGAEQQAWLHRLEQEHDNLRAALAWAQTQEPGRALPLAALLGHFWHLSGYLQEGREHLEQALAASPADAEPDMRSEALRRLGYITVEQGDYQAAQACLEQCLNISRQFGYRIRIAASLNSLGIIATRQNRAHDARALLEESLAAYRELNNRSGVMVALTSLGNLASTVGDYETARMMCEENLAQCREVGDERDIATALINLGGVCYDQSDLVQARAFYEESHVIGQAIGDDWYRAYSLEGLASIAQKEGDLDTARRLAEEGLVIVRRVGDKYETANILVTLAEVACDKQEYAQVRLLLEESLTLFQQLGNRLGILQTLEVSVRLLAGQARISASTPISREGLRAARLLGAIEALRVQIGSARPPLNVKAHQQLIADVQALPGAETFAQAWQEGQQLTLEQAAALLSADAAQ